MENHFLKDYHGLMTAKATVTTDPVMTGSITTLKVKTGEQVGSTEWQEHDVEMIIGSSSHSAGTDVSPSRSFDGSFDSSF